MDVRREFGATVVDNDSGDTNVFALRCRVCLLLEPVRHAMTFPGYMWRIDED